MVRTAAVLQNIIILSCFAFHVCYSPYTKVEESFNLHAIHDILFYGIQPQSLHKYDHVEFPGVVPRSFLGSLTLSYVAKPFIVLASTLGYVKLKGDIQTLCRLVLASANGASICWLRGTVNRRLGQYASLVFTLLTVSQYHLPFWIGRTIPNMFALFPVNCAFYLLFDRVLPSKEKGVRLESVIALLTLSAVVLRAELALLLGPLCLQLLASHPSLLFRILKSGILAGLISLCLTVAGDSYFWNRWPLWPEMNGIIFNIVQGRSSEYGISPFYTYVVNFLPKLLLGALPFSILGIIFDQRVRQIILPCIVFILAMSALGHKEWRFIVYTVPVFNIAAASGARTLTRLSGRSKSLHYLAHLTVLGAILANIILCIVFTRASTLNYPGGQGLHDFHNIYLNTSHVKLHIDNLAAQTGASLFYQLHQSPHCTSLLPDVLERIPAAAWEYSKDEHVEDFTAYTHLLTEDILPFATSCDAALAFTQLGSSSAELVTLPINITSPDACNTSPNARKWDVKYCILGFDGWQRGAKTASRWRRFTIRPRLTPKLWILERAGLDNH